MRRNVVGGVQLARPPVGGNVQLVRSPLPSDTACDSESRQERTIPERHPRRPSGRSLRGNDLRRTPGDERLTRSARGELDGATPERADPCRADEAPADRGLAVDLVRVAFRVRRNTVRPARTCDQPFQRFDRRAARAREPLVFVALDGDPANRARLRPRDLRAVIGTRHCRQLVEARCQPSRGLERPRRYTEALAGVVAETDEAEALVGAPLQQHASGTPELATHRRLAPAREAKLAIEARREAGALGFGRRIGRAFSCTVRRAIVRHALAGEVSHTRRVARSARFRRKGRRRAGAVGPARGGGDARGLRTQSVVVGRTPQPSHDAAQAEEPPWSAGTRGGQEQLLVHFPVSILLDLDTEMVMFRSTSTMGEH